MSRLVRLGICLSVLLSAAICTSAPAQAGTCGAIYGIGTQTAICFNTGSELREYIDTTEGSAYAYRLTQLCTDEGDPATCDNPRACTSGNDVGTLYMVFRRPLASLRADWEAFAVVCLTAGEEPRFEVITWMRVFEVMKTLDWPEADLVVEPVGGRTLVNFETNFYSNLTTDPQVKTVRLVGRDVQIEATAESFTWHWGDGSRTTSTSTPGAAHEDGHAHQVFHVYTDADAGVRPWVDVTYRGRYKVEDEAWRPIHETLTVEGTPVALEVVTARVHLVG